MKSCKKILLQLGLALLLSAAMLPLPAQMPDFAWAVSTGGSLTDEGMTVVIDSQGNAYCAGFHQQAADLDPGVAVLSAPGPGIHIQKLDPAGNLLWAVNYASTGFFYCYDLALDANGNLLAVGTFTGTIDFDPSAGLSNLTAAGGQDVFLLKLTPSGGLVFATSPLSGPGQNETPKGIALDAQGNIVIGGWFDGTADADPGTGTHMLGSSGGNDAFLARYDANGNYLWAYALGGASSDMTTDVAIDPATGQVIAIGRFAQTVDFDPGAAVSNLTATGMFDGFILQLSAAGSLISAEALTTSASGDRCNPNAIAIDPAGNRVIAGSFFGTVDLDPGPNQATTPTNGLSDMFLLKLDTAGDYLWSHNVGGIYQDDFQTCAIDANANIYVAGTYEGSLDLDPSPAQFNTPAASLKDFALCQFSPAGGFNWAAIVSSSNNDFVNQVRISPFDEVYVTGSYYQTTDFDPGAAVFNLTSVSGADAYVFKLGACQQAIHPAAQSNGNTLVATPLGATYQWLDCDNGLAVVPGATQQTWTPPASGSYAVAVTIGNCTDTSACASISLVGRAEAGSPAVRLFPNPAGTAFSLSSDLPLGDILITNTLGQVLCDLPASGACVQTIDVRRWARGMYFVSVDRVVYRLQVE